VALDIGMYVQTLMLLLSSRGIGSCAQAALRAYEDVTREEIGIPAEEHILCGLSFGYEDLDVPANGTRQQREVLETNVRFVE